MPIVGPRTENMSTRLPPELADLVRALALKRQWTISQALLHIVEMHFNPPTLRGESPEGEGQQAE